MAAENTRDLLDEFNTNVLKAIGEVDSITQVKELLKNNYILDGYRVQIEEDKIYLQNDRELKLAEIDKEMKEAELAFKERELEQKREQFILENERRKEENEQAKRANDLKDEELKQDRKKLYIETGIKIGTVVIGGGLTWLAICVGNEGILNKTAISICEALIPRRV